MTTSYQSFHITVKALVISEGKLLLVNSSDPLRANDFECPGGRIDRGEEVISTLKRELKEEINLDLDKTKFSIELHDINQRGIADYGFDSQTDILEIYYRVQLLDPKFTWGIVHPVEHKGYIWVDRDTDFSTLSFRSQRQKEIFMNVVRFVSSL